MEYLCGTTEVITRYFCGTLTVLLHLRSSQRGDDVLAPMYATKFNVCHRVRKNSYTAKPVMSAGRHERHSYHGFTVTDTAYSNVDNTWKVTKSCRRNLAATV